MAQDIPQIPRVRYYDNQVLYVQDFDREHGFHVAHRELQTGLCYAPGVLTGLAAQDASGGKLSVAAGVAIDALGRQAVLSGGGRFGGAAVPASGGVVTLDLNNAAYYVVGQPKQWLLTIEADPTPDASDSQWIEYPKLSLVAPGSSGNSFVGLALVTVTATQTQTTDKASGKPVVTTTLALSVDATVRVAATLLPERAPAMDAAKITGMLNPSVIPPLDASSIATGTFKAALIPKLDAATIATGKLAAALIPPLDAGLITTGTLSAASIPELDASKISTGKLAAALIPGLDAALITSGVLSVDRLPPGSLDGMSAVWAADIALSARGLQVIAAPGAGSKAGYLIGLLRITAGAATYYAVGIGFPGRLVSFTSTRAISAAVKLNLYPERTAYDLAGDTGVAGLTATSVQFVGVDPTVSFNLLLPEAQLPAGSQGKIRSLVTIGTTLAAGDASPVPVGAANIVFAVRDALSPFSFAALTAAVPPAATPADLAATLSAAGAIAPEAAPQIVARQPSAFAAAAGAAQLATLLAQQFPGSTADPSQMAWALAAAGVAAADAMKALVAIKTYKLTAKTALAATAGAYPNPSVQSVIIQLQATSTAAADAAAPIRAALSASAQPMELGVILRLNFAGSADTPQQLTQCFTNAKYSGDAVNTTLKLLFPSAPPK